MSKRPEFRSFTFSILFRRAFNALFSNFLTRFSMEHPKHCTYVLYSLKDHQFYIGSSSDFDRRSNEHEQGKSKSTAPRRPFVPLLCEYYFSKKDCLRREQYFKTTAGTIFALCYKKV